MFICLFYSRNRLQLPSEADIIELEPHFRCVKNINLRRCNLRQWATVMHIARLWPNVQQLSLAENSIGFLQQPDTSIIFRQLKFLDLKGNPINYFTEMIKLGNIETLETLYCIANHLDSVKLPPCAWNEHTNIFPALVELNLSDNHLTDSHAVFNELDKLPALTNITVTISDNIGYEETFTGAIAYIHKLNVFNKKAITAPERRGAEIDIWKRFSAPWVDSKDNNEARSELLYRCRVYSKLVESMYFHNLHSTD